MPIVENSGGLKSFQIVPDSNADERRSREAGAGYEHARHPFTDGGYTIFESRLIIVRVSEDPH